MRPLHTVNKIAGCVGKVRFDSARLAHEVAKPRHRRGRTRGTPIRDQREVYRCPYCGGWHVGQRRVNLNLRRFEDEI